tara:strand:+ start:2061 stop:2294 length:234 start_codon:yes stop_codon:yes gene_type:complete
MSIKSAHTGKIGKAFINARILRSMTQEEVTNLTYINIESNYDNNMNELHNEIKKSFVQDKLDSLQLDVTVDLSESQA